MYTEIPKVEQLIQQVFAIHNKEQFIKTALDVFRFQYYNNPVYYAYCNLLKSVPGKVKSLEAIPFLPIAFFKSHNVATTQFISSTVFESSGTTGNQSSRHFINDIQVYEESFLKGFQQFYGPPEQYCVLGLLPSYLERGSSSLVYMVNRLINDSKHPLSGFYLYDMEKLATTLQHLEAQGQKTMLIGVTYALLDFATQYPMPLQHTIIMETGGMKGRKKEMLRTEVHGELQAAFNLPQVHSEYGMTELLSQAYALKEGQFTAPPWMMVLVREEDDPLAMAKMGRSGGLNVIDLANIYSCAFIATEDVGRINENETFEVLGRLDHAAIRGCSLLAL